MRLQVEEMWTSGRVVEKLLIYIVRNHNEIATFDHFGKLPQFRFGIGCTGWIGRAVQQEGFTLWTDGGFELCSGNFKTGVLGGYQELGLRPSQNDHIGIAHPIGRGDQYFVAFFKKRMKRIEQRMLATAIGD